MTNLPISAILRTYLIIKQHLIEMLIMLNISIKIDRLITYIVELWKMLQYHCGLVCRTALSEERFLYCCICMFWFLFIFVYAAFVSFDMNIFVLTFYVPIPSYTFWVSLFLLLTLFIYVCAFVHTSACISLGLVRERYIKPFTYNFS